MNKYLIINVDSIGQMWLSVLIIALLRILIFFSKFSSLLADRRTPPVNFLSFFPCRPPSRSSIGTVNRYVAQWNAVHSGIGNTAHSSAVGGGREGPLAPLLFLTLAFFASSYKHTARTICWLLDSIVKELTRLYKKVF